jgi:hemerythrin
LKTAFIEVGHYREGKGETMDFFQWKDHYSVNVPEFDRQHQRYFFLLNYAYICNRKKVQDRDFLRQIFKKLLDYVITHFEQEEWLLEEIGFEGLEGHKAQHRYFLRQLVDLCEQHFKFHTSVPRSVLDFMRDWFLTHILETDRKYGEYFKQLKEQGQDTDLASILWNSQIRDDFESRLSEAGCP